MNVVNAMTVTIEIERNGLFQGVNLEEKQMMGKQTNYYIQSI
jgi:hypothetical protein